MSLAAGSRIGPYEVVAPLGAGGMGEVWRARDASLGRDVALKVLPDALARDPERLARFEREAKVLAQLNHPNIAQIYGLETSGEQRALVMELVEGPTLAERLQSGPLPLAEASSVALQIAQALEEAHEKGIVHRDLKPQNVKASLGGKVKVLDFGLAKAFDPLSPASGGAGSPSQLAQSPTLTLGATVQGVILGTAAYMAPEQAKGLAVDKRADIWAFGVVLWEMLTGRRLFAGDSVPETLAGVLKSGIDLDAVPAETPAAVRRLIARCLERDPRRRLRDIGEARIALEQPLVEEPRAVAADGRSGRRVGAAVAAAAALAAAAWLAARATAPAPPPARAARFQIAPPAGSPYDGFAGAATPSPDGTRYLFRIDDGPIAVRRLDTLETTLLPGTERGYDPVFSPDGREIVFFSRTALARVDAAGLQPPQALAPAEDGRGATWGKGGVILYSPSAGSGLYRIDAAGGTPVAATKLDAARKEIGHLRPWFLPDGRHFLYLIRSETPENSGIYLGSLDGPEKRRLLPVSVATRYAEPGFLLYLQDQALVARPFDPRELEVAGDPRVLARGLDYDAEFDVAPFGTSAQGLLLYHPARPLEQRRLAWFDRRGALAGAVGETGETNLDLDPAGTRVAMQRVDEATRRPDIWIRDLERGTASRLTSDAPAIGPVWSPDGARIAYITLRGTERQLVVRPAAGGAETVLGIDKFFQEPIDWSPDGRHLLIELYVPGEEMNLALLPAAGGGEPVPIARSRFGEHTGRFSPDGRWIAYVSDESGREEVYVQPLPPTGAQWLVSTAGGGAPRWRSDGRELFYVQRDERGASVSMMAVAIGPAGASSTAIALGRPVELFEGASADYEPAPDGQRFLVGNPVGEFASEQPVEAIVGFPALVDSAGRANGSR